MSLRWRLALLLGGISFFAITFASAAAFVSTERELDQAAERLLNERIDLMRGTVINASQLDRGGRAPGGSLRDLQRLDAEIQVIANDGRIAVLGDVEFPVTPAVQALVGTRQGQHEYETVVEGRTYLVRAESTRSGVALVGIDRTGDLLVISGLRNRLMAIGVLATGVAATVGWIVASQVTRPIERLTEATTRVADSHDLAAIPVEGDGEVGRLAASFNAMLHALSSSKDQQRRLVEDAGHELKTPLTSVRTNVDLLRTAATLSSEDRAAILDDLNLELVELTDLVGELVDLARDPAIDAEPIVDVRLDEVVVRAAERTERRSGRSITVAVEPMVVRGRPAALDRAVSNLLGNAVKFSPDTTEIEVRQVGGRVLVRDHGPGINDLDKPHIFARFFRADATRSSPGSGLGLSIVSQVVADLSGRTIVQDPPGGGALVGFELPT